MKITTANSRTTQEPPKGPWRWLNNQTLVADHGRRSVVLCNSHGADLKTNDPETGQLVQLTHDHPVAQALEALPDLLTACEAVLSIAHGWFHDCGGLRSQLEAAIAKARGDS